MRKKTLLIISAACALSAAAALLRFSGRRPFRAMEASEILSAAVHLSPPDTTIQIADWKELVGYLQDVVIYRRDSSYRGYAGQSVTFILDLADGTQMEVLVCQPSLVINGVGYRAKYEPCEALNNYANRLLQTEDAIVIMEKPPALTVISDQTAHSALLGTYSWQQAGADGVVTNVLADCPHPLECREELPVLDTDQPTAALRFAEEPDAILQIRCWSDTYWGHPTADSWDTALAGNTIALRPGGSIYEVTAFWDPETGYGGTASYSFYINYQRAPH